MSNGKHRRLPLCSVCSVPITTYDGLNMLESTPRIRNDYPSKHPKSVKFWMTLYRASQLTDLFVFYIPQASKRLNRFSIIILCTD